LSPFGGRDVEGVRKAFKKLVPTLIWLREDSRSGFLSDGVRLGEDIQSLKNTGKAVGKQKLEVLSKVVEDLKEVKANLKSVREKLAQSPQDSKLVREEIALKRAANTLLLKGRETKAELTILTLNLRTLSLMQKSLTADQVGKMPRRS
jgi:hypothetical protein